MNISDGGARVNDEYMIFKTLNACYCLSDSAFSSNLNENSPFHKSFSFKVDVTYNRAIA